MKKLLISLVIFFSFFIFNNNIKALNYVIDYAPLTETQQGFIDNNLQDGIDTLRSKTSDLGFFQLNGNILYFNFASTTAYYWAKISLNSNNKFVLTMYYSTSLDYYSNKSTSWFTHYFYLNTNKYGSFTNYGNSNFRIISTSTITYDEYVTIYGSDYFYIDKIFPNLFIYSSDYKIKFMSSDDVYFDKFLNEVDYMPTYLDYFLISNTPTISFSSENNIVNINGEDKISSVDLTIDYGTINNDKYIYMYMYDDENIWNTYYLTDSSSITLNIDKNRHVIARVLDKETYEVIDTSTFTIANIDYSFNIDFISETLKDDFGNVYQTNITINYESLNRDLFDYQYTTDNYILDNNQLWISLDSDKSSVLLQNRDNINIIARIVDKSNENVVYSKTYKIIQNIDKPKISFKTFNNLKYLGGADAFNNAQTIVESVDLTIDYGLIDNNIYAYMWKYYDESTWNTHYLINSSIDINITKNTTIIAQVINKNTNEIVTNATYTITLINTDSPNSMFDYINNQNNTNSVFSIFSNIWNSFKNNTDIYNYLMLVITTSVIILIVKSMSK